MWYILRMRIYKELSINWNTFNFLEEHINNVVWDILEENAEHIPQNSSVKVTLEFKERDKN